MALAQASSETQMASSPWRGFAPGTWQSRVTVREFMQRNYTQQPGDTGLLEQARADGPAGHRLRHDLSRHDDREEPLCGYYPRLLQRIGEAS
jgi:hypothetical protein